MVVDELMFRYKFTHNDVKVVYHLTYARNQSSIIKSGMIPGGLQGGRIHIYVNVKIPGSNPKLRKSDPRQLEFDQFVSEVYTQR